MIIIAALIGWFRVLHSASRHYLNFFYNSWHHDILLLNLQIKTQMMNESKVGQSLRTSSQPASEFNTGSAARTAYWIMGYLYNLVALAVLCGCGSVLPFPNYSASAFMAQLWLNDRLVCICLCMRACGHHERANWEQSPIQLLRFRHRHSSSGVIQ